MSKKYIILIKDNEGSVITNVSGASLRYGYKRYRKLFGTTEPVKAEWYVTTDGERITSVKNLKKGDYFVLVDPSRNKKKCVYVRGDYDKGKDMYECYKFHDMNSTRYFKSWQLVTDEMTF